MTEMNIHPHSEDNPGLEIQVAPPEPGVITPISPSDKLAREMAESLGRPVEDMTPEQFVIEVAQQATWYSSNISEKTKTTPEGEEIFGLYLTTNPTYSQTYVRDGGVKAINQFSLSQANLKITSFDYGMTIDASKRAEILGEGYDGVIFAGMGGPEVALLTNVAEAKGRVVPIPAGIQARVDNRRSLPERLVREYELQLPQGYVLRDGQYIYESVG